MKGRLTIKLSSLKFRNMLVSFSKEDYLKEIYKMSGSNNLRVSTAHLAEKLEVTNAATSEMAKKLHSQGFVHYEKYKGLKLTAKGEKLALNMLRRHRLWETFLIKTLDFSWSQVHREAEILEHQTSDLLIDKIDSHLGYPEFDPHGDPIPNKNGKMPVCPELISLAEAKVGSSYYVARVDHQNEEVMEYFTSLGIELNTKIELMNRLEFDNSIFILFNNKKHSFSATLANKLFVIKKTNEDLSGQ